jgi:phage-related protein
MTPVLTLIDDDSNAFTFEKDFWVKDYDLNINVNIKNYTYAAGGKNTADGYPKSRQITVKGILWAETLTELETKRRAIFQACLKGGKLQKSDDIVSRYIDVRYANFAYSQGRWRNAENITITFIAEFPFWQDSSLTTYEIVTPSSLFSFNVDATGSDFIMLPLIEFENTEGTDSPTVSLTNDTDGGVTFEYQDSGFVVDDLLEVNSSLGTVLKNSNNAVEYATKPWFLRLQPSINTFSYDGSLLTIRIKYRKVYI